MKQFEEIKRKYLKERTMRELVLFNTRELIKVRI